MESVKKIGEGSYGEVFKIGEGVVLDNEKVEPAVIKVIPVDGNAIVNGEKQKSLLEVIPEILIAQELCWLRDFVDEKGGHWSTTNFIPVISVSIVQGSLPLCMLEAWDAWNGAEGRSENDRPDFFPSRQLFLVFEFEDGGLDLESFLFASAAEAKSVLLQTVLGLGVAEAALEFEHRDLHIGNVLVKRTEEEDVTFVLDDRRFRFASHGVKVHIIDYTNSRLTKKKCRIFTDLAEDEELFKGDASEYQFEVYRLMRQVNGNSWREFHPRTNVLWLHYLVDKLLTTKCFQPKSVKAKSDCVQLRGKERKELLTLRDQVWEAGSCLGLATGSHSAAFDALCHQAAL